MNQNDINYVSSTQYKNKVVADQPDSGLTDLQKCIVSMATDYNLADSEGNFDDTILSKNEQQNILNNEYNFCTEGGEDGNLYYNCALKNNNIWLKNNDTCSISTTLTSLPKSFEKQEGTNNIIKPQPIKFVKNLEYDDGLSDVKICQERWYDWFTIHDYHNGNKYSMDISAGELDKLLCLKPCNFGEIIIDDGSNFFKKENKCINRDLIDNGRLKNTMLYTPYAIIFLFGLTKQDIIEINKHESNDINNNILSKTNANSDIKYEIDKKLFTEIYENEATVNNIANKIIADMQISIKNLVTEPISHLNIIPPYDNLNKLNIKPTEYYKKEVFVTKAYEIANNLNDYLRNSELKQDFYLWKKRLSEVNSFDINSWEFNKILLLLQSACALCFGYQNPKDKLYNKQVQYNNYVFKNLINSNKDKSFSRINFPEITNAQVLKSIDTNNPFNNMDDEILSKISMSKVKDWQSTHQDDLTETEDPEKTDITLCDVNFKNEEGIPILNIDQCNIDIMCEHIDIFMMDNCVTSFIINMSNAIFVLMVIIFYVFMSYLLIMSIWPSFSNVINYIIYGFIWICSMFFGVFNYINYKKNDAKGILLNIHKMALTGEYLTDNFLQSLAKINQENQVVFLLLIGLMSVFIGIILIKNMADIPIIFTSDGKISSTTSAERRIMEFIFAC